MIDIHSHILPNMDDGSASPEQTNEILNLMYQQGLTAVGATSHFYASKETPAEFLARREESMKSLIPSDGQHHRGQRLCVPLLLPVPVPPGRSVRSV